MKRNEDSEMMVGANQYSQPQASRGAESQVLLGQMGEKGQQFGIAENVTINNFTDGKTNNSGSHELTLEEQLKYYAGQFALYQELGIINCTQGLKGTQLAPLECMPNVHKSLYFMGVGGEKWVKDEQLRKTFSKMLLRSKSVGGEVRFLLIDPASDAYSNLYSMRGESVPFESYERFVDLKKKHPNLQVHLYDHLPSFRMQFVDDQYLAVSRYYFDKNAHDRWEGGWKIPHLIIRNVYQEYGHEEVIHKWSLFESFQLAYEFGWDKGRDIMEWVEEGKKFNK